MGTSIAAAVRGGFAGKLVIACSVLAWSTFAVAQPADPAPDKEPAADKDGSKDEAAPGATAPAGSPPAGSPPAGSPPAGADDDVPVALRLRSLEQRVQALKERAWRAKARVGMLKEAVLGGGVGSRASIVHVNEMGNSYRLIRLVYALDGAQVFSRNDPSGDLHKSKTYDILTGPVAPGSHTISVLAIYKGHGYGVFKYLNKYRFTVRSSHTFTAGEGKATSIRVVAYEKGGVGTPLEDRPAIDFKVNVATGAAK